MIAPKYLTRIYWSEDDEAFVAEVPSLPGCVSHGDTMTEAAANVQEAMELWLESAERHGDDIPEPDTMRERLIGYGALLNVSELARRSGLKRPTLVSKLQRNTKFSREEVVALRKALDTFSITDMGGKAASKTGSPKANAPKSGTRR